MARPAPTAEDLAEQALLGARIKHFRELRGLQKNELAAALHLDPSAVTHIEAGTRSVSTARLNALARALGVSVLALLDDDNPLGELAVAARTSAGTHGTTAVGTDEPIVERAMGLAELSQVLSDGGVPVPPAPEAPAVRLAQWKADSARLADWALARLGRSYLCHGPDVPAAVEDELGIDVLAEPFEGGPWGLSAALGAARLIVLNTTQDQRKMTFTLAHELGHLLADAHAPLCVTTSFASTDDRERFANAFAACVLAPEAELRRRFLAGVPLGPDVLVRAFLELGLSWQALVYRLHNTGLTNAAGRDHLLSTSVWQLALDCDDARLRDRVERDDRGPTRAHRPPRLLTQRAARGYLAGAVSIRPYAGLTRMDPAEAEVQLDDHTAEPTTEYVPF